MNIRYRVELNDAERTELEALLAGGKAPVRKLKRAQILLAADVGLGDEVIATSVHTGTATVYRTKRNFVEGNLEHALTEQSRPGAKRKLSSKEEALLVAKACSVPPEGRARWTLELLAGAIVALTDHEELSTETVRRRLSENKLKPWRQEMWCVPVVNGEYVARMEDVLDLYAEAPDPLRPVVCFDESPQQLIGEVRGPIPAAPGKLLQYDSEYVRNGTVNLFIFLDAHRGWRHVKVTDRRTSVDFAECMRELVDVHYPGVERIRVVLDNLSTHGPGALYEAFEPAEARRVLRRLEFHFVPKHASWLNMVEIEIGVLRGQCLDRRIEDRATLETEIAAWEKQRNEAGARIEWMFTTEKARAKMGRVYPKRTAADATLSTGLASEASAASPVADASAVSPAVEPNAALSPLEPKPAPSADSTSAASPSTPASEPSTASPGSVQRRASRTSGTRISVSTSESSDTSPTPGTVRRAASLVPPTRTSKVSPNGHATKPAKVKKKPTRRRPAGPRSQFKARPVLPKRRRGKKSAR